MHQNMHASSFLLVPLGLLGLLLMTVVLLLLAFKATRPAGWALLGVALVAVLLLVGYTSVRVERHVAPAVAVSPAPVDVETVLEPWIRVEHAEVEHAESGASVHVHSAHPAAPARPLEITSPAPEPTSGNPPEPDSDDDSAEDSRTGHTAVSAAEEDHAEVVHTAGTIESSASKNRPAWVDQAPSRDGSSYPVVIVTDAHTKRQDAERQVNELIVVKTAEVLGDLVGSPLVDRQHGMNSEWIYEISLNHLHNLGLTPGMVRNRVWRDEYVEHSALELPSGQYGSLPMVQIHTLLSYDQELQNDLQERWRRSQAHQRLGAVGIIAASVLGLLTLVWGALRFDTATKGYYTRWLLLGAGAATIAVVLFVIAAA